MGEGEVGAEMRAGGAHGRRTRENAGLRALGHFVRLAQQGLDGRAQHAGSQFAETRQEVLAAHLQAGGANFGFQQRFGFLDHDQGIDLTGEGANLVQRRRATEAELEHGRGGEGLADVHESGAGGDETDAPVAAGKGDVEIDGFAQLPEFPVALVHHGQARLGVGRGHHPALGVFLESGGAMLDALAFDRDHGLDVADAGGHADDDRHFVLFREGESPLDHLVGFLRVGRLQDRHVAEAPPIARILFVLGGGEANVVGHHDDQPADDAG